MDAVYLLCDTAVNERVRRIMLDAVSAERRYPGNAYLIARAARVVSVIHRQRATALELQILTYEWKRQCPGENVAACNTQIDSLREEMIKELALAAEFERQSEGV